MLRKMGFASFLAILFVWLCAFETAGAQSPVTGRNTRPLVTRPVNENQRIALAGNTRPEARTENDRGAVAADFPMQHMLLQLKRSAEQEQALEQFIDELQDKNSPTFHQWITAQEFGERFGLAQQDLDSITAWLESHGFQVNIVYPSGMLIDFSGTAGRVREAFRTEIHQLSVRGGNHIANVSDPQIPAAFASVIAGIVSLHDFQPRAMYRLRSAHANDTFPSGYGTNTYALVPSDLATIYNLNPLFNEGISGQGQTIALIEDTNLYSATDWSTFRSVLGLSAYTSGSLSTVHPAPASGTNNCFSPGLVPTNDAEAILDAEWASAAAPSAAIMMATCADTGATFGGLIAVQNLINGSGPPPAIMSISYGQCETVNGAAANAAYKAAYQQAVTEGVSVFVASGDSGAAGCDNNASGATHGIGVNAFASTPYNVAVGGTDFSDTYSGTNTTYWNASNSSTFGSAISYIPEIPWNDSCASGLVASFKGFSLTYGPTSFCNNSSVGANLETTDAGGGGPSACATGSPAPAGSAIVSGTCQGWPKPAWQSVLGNPNDGVRDIPDVSLFAANGLWGHYYLFCWSDLTYGGAPCTLNPSGWSGAGGTSFASPIMAGVQALINQRAGGTQGNPNPFYYELAAAEYGGSGSSCNSSNGNQVANSCTFYDVTLGDMDVNCSGSVACYLDGGVVGVLSTSNSAFNPAYPAATGWDFATGIGTVNVTNLVNNWPTAGPYFTLSASPDNVAVTQGTSGTSNVTIVPQKGFTGSVAFSASGLPSGVTALFSPTSSTTGTTLTLTANATTVIGTTSVTIRGTSGNLTSFATLTLVVNPMGNYTLTASPAAMSVMQGTSGSSTITVTPQRGFNSSVRLAVSGLPAGVTGSFGTNPTTSTSTLTLTASRTATVGPVSLTITGTSGNLSNATTIALTVSGAPNFSLSVSPSSLTVPQSSTGQSTITVVGVYGFSGSVNLSVSGVSSGVSATFSTNPTLGASTLTLAANSVAATGTATLTVTGVSGSLTSTTTISLTVTYVPTLPPGWTDGDIGATGVAGGASYANNVFTVAGAGQEIYGSADGFHFVYQPLSGDGTIVARLVSFQGGVGYAAAGVMMRNALDAGSANAKTAEWPVYGGIYFDVRTAEGGSTSEPGSVNVTLPYWVKVSRSGNAFSSYVALDGVNWVQVGASQTIAMGTNAYVGLGVASGSTTATATATFDNVSVNGSAVPGPVISGVSATTGMAGSVVVINGANFGGTQGSSAVLLNGAAVTVNTWSAGSINVTVPAGATSGPLVMTVGPGMNDSNAVEFTVTGEPLPSGWLDQDVGAAGVAGSGTYTNGVFTVVGGGTEIYGSADGFHFVYQAMSGDGTVVARVVSVQGGVGYAAAGVMIRNGLDAGAANAKTAEWPVYAGIYFDVRTTEGGSTSEPGSMNVALPYWVKVIRSGNTFSSYVAPDGVNWVQLGTSQTINMGTTVYVGLGLASGSTKATATASFDNVSITAPAPPAQNFTLSTSPSSLTITQASSGTSTITVTPQNGFSGSVSLSATGLPTGVTASFSTNPTTSTSTLTLTANGAAATGAATVTITGVSGNLTNTATVSLTVNAAAVPSFTLSAAPGNLTIAQGAAGTSTISITPQNGFSGSVSLSVSGLPTGVTASFNTNPAATTSTLTLTVSATATTGPANVTVTGTSGGLTNAATIALTVQSAAAPPTLPPGWTDGDIGATGVAGGASYANNVFTVAGAGQEIYGSADGFHFVYQPLSGDGTIVARLVSFQGGVGYAAAGVMMRNALDAGSANAKTAEWPVYGGIYFDVRTAEGGSTSEPGSVNVTLPYWVKVSRSGNAFSSYVALDGVNWVQVGASQTIAMGTNAYVGLGVASGSTTATATATFDNVSVNGSAVPGPVISGVSATTGMAGSVVVINGANFGGTQGSSAVLLNGAAVTVNTWSAGSINVTVPAGATSGPLVMTVGPGMNDSNAVEFTVTGEPLPSGWLDQDVGAAGVAGSGTYTNGVFTVVGGGTEIYGSADGFHFVYQAMSGDGTVVARVVSVQGGVGYAAAGVMIRNGLDAGAANAKTAEWPVYAGIYFDVRTTEGGSTSEPGSMNVALPYWVKVIRSGNTFSSYVAPDGVNWVQLGTSQTINMGTTVYVGLGLASGSTKATATASFDNVSVTSP